MTENKRFRFNGCTNCIEYEDKSILLDSYGEDVVELLNELNDENTELKAKVDDKEVAVEVETCKVMEKVFALIDKKIDELEKRYKFGQEVAECCPMHNIMHSINTLKELKKELRE